MYVHGRGRSVVHWMAAYIGYSLPRDATRAAQATRTHAHVCCAESEGEAESKQRSIAVGAGHTVDHIRRCSKWGIDVYGHASHVPYIIRSSDRDSSDGNKHARI